ncbi:unnamed protein product [Camellia sinensis]
MVSECSPADNTGRAAALMVFGFLQGFQAWEVRERSIESWWQVFSISESFSAFEFSVVFGQSFKDLSTKVDDVETELRGAEHHPAKRPRKVAQHWCKNAQEMIESMQRLEEEVNGLGQWMFVSHALLGKHVEEKIQEVVELQEQHNFPCGVLIDALPTSEEFIPTARFFRGSETITARNKGKYLMDDEITMSKGSCNHLARSDYIHTSISAIIPEASITATIIGTFISTCNHITTIIITSHLSVVKAKLGASRSGILVDIQFDSTFQSVGDQDASLNGQLGQIVRNGTKFASRDIDSKLQQLGASWPTSYDGADTFLANTTSSIVTGIIGNSWTSPSPSRRHNLGIFRHIGGMRGACGVQTWCGSITCIPSLNDGRDHSTSLGEVNAGAGLNDCPKHTTNM